MQQQSKSQKTKTKQEQKPKNKIKKPQSKTQKNLKNLIFVILIVVAYCTQLLSQAMYNLMMATTMAETCSC